MPDQQRKLILETLETLFELQLKGVRQALGKEDSQVDVVRQKRGKRKSLVNLCAEILTGEESPVHVDELVEILLERYGRMTDRDSLSSALAKKAKQGILVRRVSPATFQILE